MKNNPALFILCGKPFSGKSTLAKKISELYSAKIIGRDEVFFALDGLLALDDTPEQDDASMWDSLWPVTVQGIKNQLLLGNSVVCDDTSSLFRQREALRTLAQQLGIKSVLVYLDIPDEVRKARKEENKITMHRHDVPSGLFEEYAKTFEYPLSVENPLVYKGDVDIKDSLKEALA